MKLRVLSASLLFLLASAGLGYCQDSSAVGTAGQVWKTTLYVETGYTTFALGDEHTAFESVLNVYRRIEIPLQAQTMFPGNMLIGGTVLFTTDIPVSIGLGGYYSKTAAASSYRDFAGTLLERMDVSLITVNMTVQVNPLPYFPPLYICAHPGFSYSDLLYTENASLSYPATQSSTTTQEGHGYLITAEAGVGLSFKLRGVPVAVEADYREGKTSQLTDTQGYINIPLDISGFVLKARVGVGL